MRYSQSFFYFTLKSDIQYKTFVFDNVILYYDNGQHELNRILNAVLSTELSHYDIRKVLPKDYKLFQAADLICTIQLLALKREHKELSNSELLLFHNERELNKQFIKPIMKKQFEFNNQ